MGDSDQTAIIRILEENGVLVTPANRRDEFVLSAASRQFVGDAHPTLVLDSQRLESFLDAAVADPIPGHLPPTASSEDKRASSRGFMAWRILEQLESGDEDTPPIVGLGVSADGWFVERAAANAAKPFSDQDLPEDLYWSPFPRPDSD